MKGKDSLNFALVAAMVFAGAEHVWCCGLG